MPAQYRPVALDTIIVLSHFLTYLLCVQQAALWTNPALMTSPYDVTLPGLSMMMMMTMMWRFAAAAGRYLSTSSGSPALINSWKHQLLTSSTSNTTTTQDVSRPDAAVTPQ